MAAGERSDGSEVIQVIDDLKGHLQRQVDSAAGTLFQEAAELRGIAGLLEGLAELRIDTEGADLLEHAAAVGAAAMQAIATGCGALGVSEQLAACAGVRLTINNGG